MAAAAERYRMTEQTQKRGPIELISRAKKSDVAVRARVRNDGTVSSEFPRTIEV